MTDDPLDMLDIAISIESESWTAELPGIADHVERAAIAALNAACPTLTEAAVGVLLADDATIHAMNRDWRSIDAPTNVLSFPATDTKPGETPRAAHAGPPLMLGDVALAFETCAREAREQAIPFADHVGHLVVHGTLHLLGYDHEDDIEAEVMEALEARILETLDIPDPYAAERPHG
jgi:probable rRNA maturation factor